MSPLFAVTISDNGVWTLVGVMLTGLLCTLGWMLRIDRQGTRIDGQLDLIRDKLSSIDRLWVVHERDVESLKSLESRVVRLEAQVDALQGREVDRDRSPL